MRSAAPVTPEVEEGLESIGLLIREKRLRLLLSQSALERESGVDQTTISRLERGVLYHCRLMRLARIFGVLYPPDRRW